MKKHKGWKESFARFFEEPTREGLRDLLRENVGEFGFTDFKRSWPIGSKLARHLLGLANSGGGIIVVGVEETSSRALEPVGVSSLVDKVKIENSVDRFLPHQLRFEVFDFSFEDSEYKRIVGKQFQVALVEDMPKNIPFVSMADGEGIRKNAIYTRKGTSSEEVGYENLQEMINRRIETEYSSSNEMMLDSHLEELRMLYSHIPRYQGRLSAMILRATNQVVNPKYPKESFEDYVGQLIHKKKRIIESVLLKQQP